MLPLMLLATSLAIFVIYLLFPSLFWALLTVEDDRYARDTGLGLVAYRKPFRETSVPVCMAQLILLRQKIHQTNIRRRKSASQMRQAQRNYSLVPTRSNPKSSFSTRPQSSWIRFGRPFGK